MLADACPFCYFKTGGVPASLAREDATELFDIINPFHSFRGLCKQAPTQGKAPKGDPSIEEPPAGWE